MLTEQNKKDIKTLYLEKGFNRETIAKELNLSEWNIKIFLTENKLKYEKDERIKNNLLQKKYNPLLTYKKQGYVLTEENKIEITKLYKENISCINKNCISFVCNSELFLNKIKDFLNLETKQQRLLTKVKDKSYYIISYHSLQAKKYIFNYFYTNATIFLERKKNKFNLD